MTPVISMILLLVYMARGQEAVIYAGKGVSNSLDGDNNSTILVLGGLFPVHTFEDGSCGGIFDLGVQTLEAMVLATDSINSDSSLIPGVTLQFDIRDTCTIGNKALEQSLEFVCVRGSENEASSVNGTAVGVSGVVGAALSRVSEPVARLLRLFEVPQISYASTADTLSDKATFDYFLRTVPPDSLQAQAIADIVEHFNWTYVVAMHTGDVYGTEGIKAFIDELDRRNNMTKKCIATLQSIELESDAEVEDFDEAIERINQEWVRNATVAVLFVQLKTAIGVLEAVGRKRKMDPEFASKNFTWIGSDGWGDQLPKELHEVACGSLSIVPRSLMSDKFDEYFQSLHPLNYTANPWFGEYWESIFNCSLSPDSDLKICDVTAQHISQESGYRQNSFVTFTIDAVYAFAHSVHKLQQIFCQGGPGLCPEILDSRSGGIVIQGDLLLGHLRNISFSPGASNEIIDFSSDGEQMGKYSVLNLKQNSSGRFIFETVGHWDKVPLNGSTQLNLFGEIQWSHGLSNDDTPESLCSYPCKTGEYREPLADQAECCWVCKACPGSNAVSTGIACRECDRGQTPNEKRTQCILIQPDYLTWSDGWSIAILILTSVGIIITTIIAVIFAVHYDHQLIKASSRELIAVLLTGILLCYFLPFFFVAKPSPWICAVRRFGVGFCFAVCYSALLVKTNRIHRIFNRPPDTVQRPRLVTPLSQLVFTFLLLCIQVIVGAIWLAIERPSTEDLHISQSTTELICGECRIIGLIVTLGYNAILLLVTIYFAFRSRKVPQNFNEAKFINLTVYSLCILWLAFIPFYFGTALIGTTYQTGSLMLAIILNATITLCTLFVPKVYFLFSRIKKDSSNHSEAVANRMYSTIGTQHVQRMSSSLSLRISQSTNVRNSNSMANTPINGGGHSPVTPNCVDDCKKSCEPSDSVSVPR